MKQPPAFDAYAADYDVEFTDTTIGRAQRGQVWRWLQPLLHRPLRILEINCGTGADALDLARQGHTVVATDVSSQMVYQAEKKLTEEKKDLDISFRTVDLRDLEDHFAPNQFDLVFSNFGGLNCISPQEHQTLSFVFHRLTTARGCLFFVYMSRDCLWERFYFTCKNQPVTARRRRQLDPQTVAVKSSRIKVWYYRPGEVQSLLAQKWHQKMVKPVGLIVPPSYLGEAFRNRQRWISFFDRLDREWLGRPFLADYADHFALIMEKKKP